MNKMAMGVVALTAVLASPMAMAEDIIVQANETKSITSTPTEQPESAEIHGTWTVSGGAVVARFAADGRARGRKGCAGRRVLPCLHALAV